MLEVTANTAATLPVYLKDASDDPVTGIAYGDATCKYTKAGAAIGTLSLSGSNWTEIGQGVYTVDFTASETDTEGWFTYIVTGTGAKQYVNTVNVVKKGEVFVLGAYSDSANELVIRAWLEIDGEIYTTPDSCSISIKDDTDVERFTPSSLSASADGFFTMTESSPSLEDDHAYSVYAEIVVGSNTYSSGTCMMTMT